MMRSLAWAALVSLLTLFAPSAWATPDSLYDAFGYAQKIEMQLDKDISREHVAELRTRLDLELTTAMRNDPAFARSTVRYSPFDMLKLLTTLAILEGRPAEALVALERALALSTLAPEERRAVLRARGAVLVMDDQITAGRAQYAAGLCTNTPGCSTPSPSACFPFWADEVHISWETLTEGPEGACVAGQFERAAMLAEMQSLTYLAEPLRRLAIEASFAARDADPDAAQLLVITVNNHALFLNGLDRRTEAAALVSRLESDPKYLSTKQALMGPAPTLPVPSQPRFMKRSPAQLDAAIATAKKSIFDIGEGDNLAFPTRAGGVRLADGFRHLSGLYEERGAIAQALDANLQALRYAGRSLSPFLPIKAELGPAAPDCPPGARAEPRCRSWYPDLIARVGSLRLADLLADRAILEAKAGNPGEALLVDGYASQVLQNWLRRNWTESRDVIAAFRERAPSNDRRLAMLAGLKGRPAAAGSAEDHAFQIAQVMQFGPLDAALRSSAVRARLPSREAGLAFQQWQLLLERRRAEIAPSAREDLSRRIAALERDLGPSVSAFEQRTAFAPVALDRARARLGRDEALLVVLPLQDRTEIFALDTGSARWVTAGVGAAWIAERVRKLRAHLDAGSDSALPFDRVAAHELYSELVRPVQEVLGTKLVYVSASGPMANLPMSLLVTTPPVGPETTSSLRATRWLFQTNPLVTLPSVSFFVSQGVEPRPGRRLAMVGFGAVPAEARLAIVEERANLGELPFAADELRALAAARTGRVELVLGGEATEGRLRRTDLGSANVIAFATHAVTGGDNGEPGLILAKGAGDAGDDGFLAASEVLSLPIGADVVVLSACNTAAADGRGGEALSGLAQSFLFSGGGSVLASHWPVYDSSAAAITVPTLRGNSADVAALSRRLAAAMDRMIKDFARPELAGPRHWAPFVVVGS